MADGRTWNLVAMLLPRLLLRSTCRQGRVEMWSLELSLGKWPQAQIQGSITDLANQRWCVSLVIQQHLEIKGAAGALSLPKCLSACTSIA